MKEITQNAFLTDLTNKVEVSKKWRATGIRKCVTHIMNYISFFNSLEEDVIFVDGRTIDQIQIPSEFKDFIIPNSVRLVAGDRRYPNIVLRDSDPTGTVIFESENDSITFKYNYLEWMNLITQFRGFFKKDLSSDMISLSELRLNKSISDISDIVVVNNEVKYEGVDFIPLRIVEPYELIFSSNAQKTSVAEMLEYYVANWKF